MKEVSSESIKRAKKASKAWRGRLLQWYDKHGRKDLPWRNLGQHRGDSELGRDSEPRQNFQNLQVQSSPLRLHAPSPHQNLAHIDKAYGVYISEIMLQQTQVGRVLQSYYFPFLEAFPTLEALALATESEVLKRWEGLGYYSRARNLHKAAKICLQRHGGKLPSSKEELLALPGIGAYSAGAILCFGFGKSVSFVDGNIRRVLSRTFALSEPKMRELEALAKILLCPVRSFDYNQALLDVGALLCMPKAPACGICPLDKLCLGGANPKLYPAPKSYTLVPLSLHLAYCVDKSGRLALLQSKERLYHGLYNLPKLSDVGFTDVEFAVGLDSEKSHLELVGSFNHHYTKYAIGVHVYKIPLHTIQPPQGIEFFTPDELAQKPLSSLSLKALKLCGVISESSRDNTPNHN